MSPDEPLRDHSVRSCYYGLVDPVLPTVATRMFGLRCCSSMGVPLPTCAAPLMNANGKLPAIDAIWQAALPSDPLTCPSISHAT